MKKTIILLSTILVGYLATAQLNVSVEAGHNFKNAKPVMGLNVGANLRGFTLSGGYLVHVSNKINGGAVFNIKTGYQLPIGERYFVNPNFGYFSWLRSAEKTNLNTYGFIYGLIVVKQMKDFEQGQLFVSGNYAKNLLSITAGLKFVFVKD